MKCYQMMVKEVTELLSSQKLPYKDTIVIGDNSSGKSDILLQYIQYNPDEDIYFIDAVNRYFDISQVGEGIPDEIVFSPEINKNRLAEDKFNLEDSFYYKGVPRAVEDFYMAYHESVQEMMKQFLDISFEVRKGITGWGAYSNDTEIKMSSGYQALLRIFLELTYYTSTVGKGMVIIDEIDEYLSVNNCRNIFGFLRGRFPNLNFMVTTHSADLIAAARCANLISLQKDEFEILDAGDFESISQVYNIFKKSFSDQPMTEKQSADEKLRRLLNNKVAGVWSKKEEELLKELEKSNLTKAQKVLLRQIREW